MSGAGAAGVIFIDAVIRRNCNTNRFRPGKIFWANPSLNIFAYLDDSCRNRRSLTSALSGIKKNAND